MPLPVTVSLPAVALTVTMPVKLLASMVLLLLPPVRLAEAMRASVTLPAAVRPS